MRDKVKEICTLHSHDLAHVFIGFQVWCVFWLVDQTSNSIHCIQIAVVFFLLSSPKVVAFSDMGSLWLAAQDCLNDTQHLSSVLRSHLKPRDYTGHPTSHDQQWPRDTVICLINICYVDRGARNTNQVCFFSNLGLYYDFLKTWDNSHTIKVTKVCNLMGFSIFVDLCNHHHNQF